MINNLAARTAPHSGCSRGLTLLQLVRDQRGVSLVLILSILVLFGALGMVTHSLVTTDLHSSVLHQEAAQALWAAEAGMELTCRYLRWAIPPPGGTEPFLQYEDVPVGSGTFTVTIDPDDNNPNTYLKAYTVTSVGQAGDARRAIRVHLGMKTFGNYAYVTHSEGGIIWFVTGDVIEGPLHSNDRISIYSRPTFMGQVTSSASSFRQGPYFNPDFREGYQLGVPPIQFPTFQDLVDNYWAVNTNPPKVVLDARYSRHAKVKFHADGTLTYCVWHNTSSGKVYDVSPTTRPVSDLDGILFVRGDVRVSGVVNGQITIIATQLIKIIDDVRYAAASSNGQPLPGCDDLLGLISAGNIVIADNAANRNDVVIDAGILALGNSFTVQNYDQGLPRGYIHLWGSLAQKVRGPVGTFGWFGQTGYLKDYHYDTRFVDTPPPYYPSTGQYQIYSWQEVDPD